MNQVIFAGVLIVFLACVIAPLFKDDESNQNKEQ